MKILRIYTKLPPYGGGMEKHIKELTLRQIEHGNEVSIFFNKGDSVSEKDVRIPKFPLGDFKPQFIGVFIFYFFIIFHLILTRKKYHVLHIHGDWSSVFFSKIIKNCINAKKVIFSIHDDFNNNFSRIFFKKKLRHIDIFFSTGYNSFQFLKKTNKPNTFFQPSGVSSLFFADCGINIMNKNIDVISIGNLVSKKNLDLVLNIAKSLPNNSFVIVGEGNQRRHLSSRIKNEKIYNLELIGHKTQQQVKNLLCMSRLFLHTAKIEGTPTSIMEAMAVGLPIISTNAGGIKKVIGSDNFLFEEKEEFVEAIKKLLADNELYKEISSLNKLKAKDFSWDKVFNSINSKF